MQQGYPISANWIGKTPSEQPYVKNHCEAIKTIVFQIKSWVT